MIIITVCSIGACNKRSNTDNKAEKPNLLFVFSDQFRKQALGFMNEDPVITPNLDRLAEEGLAFTSAVSTTPICSPFRAMLMTGKFPLSTGVTANCMPGTDLEMKTGERCIGDILKENGYLTGYIGKWHLEIPSLNRTTTPKDSALDAWDGWTPPGPRRHGFDFWYTYNCNGKHFDPNYWKDSPERIDIRQWSVEHETDKAIEFLDNINNDKPFAVYNFMPTILGLMEIEIPETVEGTDYSGLLLGKDQSKASSALISSYGNPGNLLDKGQPPSIWALQADSLHKSGVDWRTVGYRGLRTEQYTYVVDRGRKGNYLKRYLYDNQADPYQLDPVIAEKPDGIEVMEILDRELKDWLKKTNDPFPL